MVRLDPARVADFARSRDLEFVALFGSCARTGTGHDVDLALMPDRPEAGGGRLQYVTDLCAHFGRGDLDAAWLPTASWLLCSEVARDGVALYEKRAHAFRAFRLAAGLRYADSQVWRERQREGLRRIIPKDRRMNADLIREKLLGMAEYLAELRQMLDVPRPVFLAKVMRYRAAERNLELLVEHAGLINNEVATSQGVSATDYYSSFFALEQAGWIEPDLAQRLAPLASLRNVLVHAYQKVDRERLYDALLGSLEAWQSYLEAIERGLER